MATTIATMSTAAIGAAPKLQHLSMLSTHPQARVGHSIGSARGFHWNSRGGYGVRNGHKKALIVRSSVSTVEGTELDAISKFSEIVPDTVIFDDFERFPPTAATVSSSLLLGITSLPKAGYNGAIDSALAYGKCYLEKSSGARLSCFLSKVLGTFQATMYICIPASQLHAWDNMAVLLFVHIAILKGT
jgi:transaldolase